MATDDDDTLEFVASEILSDRLFAVTFKPVRVDVCAATHVGNVRSKNEDHHAVIRRKRAQEVIASDVDLAPGTVDDAYVIMVADGMGGADFGEFASRVVIQTAWEMMSHAASWVMKLEDVDAQQMFERIQAYITIIERTLREHAAADRRLQRMGTTFTAVCIMGHDAVAAHLGDSRVYLFRDDVLTQITSDHTLEQKLLNLGHTPESVRRYRNVLVNCLAVDGVSEVEMRHFELQDKDRILVCSDGLTNEVSDEAILSVLARRESPESTCNALVADALANGGRDNVTAVVADVTDAPEPSTEG